MADLEPGNVPEPSAENRPVHRLPERRALDPESEAWGNYQRNLSIWIAVGVFGFLAVIQPFIGFALVPVLLVFAFYTGWKAQRAAKAADEGTTEGETPPRRGDDLKKTG